MAYAATALLSVLSFRRSGIARADISIIARKTCTDRRDNENGRCRSSSRLDAHSIFSGRKRSSMVIFDYAVILWRRAITAAPPPRCSGSGTRRPVPKRCADYSLRASAPSAYLPIPLCATNVALLPPLPVGSIFPARNRGWLARHQR